MAGALLAIGMGLGTGHVLGTLTELAALTRARRLSVPAVAAAAVFALMAAQMRLLELRHGMTHGQELQGFAVCGGAAAGVAMELGCFLLGLVKRGSRSALCAASLLLAGAIAYLADQALPFDNYLEAHFALRSEALLGLGLGLSATILTLPACAVLARTAAGLTGARVAGATASALVAAAVVLECAPAISCTILLDRPISRYLLQGARRMSDWDRDGFSSLFGGGDCAPFDPRRNPLAREQPGNGIDDDCRGGDAAPRSPAASIAPQAVSYSRAAPSVILITAEALRVDHLSLYGYERNTTPALKAWAQSAQRFDNAVSGTRTAISLPTLFFGRRAARLRWTRLADTTEDRLVPLAKLHEGEHVRRPLVAALAQPFRSLPALLHARGLHTMALVDDGCFPLLKQLPGYTGDFDEYYTIGNAADDAMTAKGARLLLAQQTGPFFLWVHFFGAHEPFTRHFDVHDFGNDVVGHYDHEIAYLDQQLAGLLADVDALARRQQIALIFAADHGETMSFVEHDHGLNVEEGVIHIPLLAKLPGVPPGVVGGVVSQLDIMPTILRSVGVEPDTDLDGVDLHEVIARGGDAERVIVTGAWSWDFDFKPQVGSVAAVGLGRKATFDIVEQRRFVTRFGDFRETPLPADAHSARLFGAIDDYLDHYGPVLAR